MNGIEKGKTIKSVKLKADPMKRLIKLLAFKLD